MSQILKLVEDNNGTITSSQVSAAGISRGSLKYLVDRGVLERAGRGVYVKPNIWYDELFNLQTRYKKGIFFGETALFLHDLTDRTPARFILAFPLQYNISMLALNDHLEYIRFKNSVYELGVTTVKTPGGNVVRVYNKERTLCDIIKTRYHTDIQLISEAFKRYARSNDRNIPLLSEYSRVLRVEKKLRSYLEVLI